MTGGVLEALFAPRGIAVVGASTDPAKLGAALARSVAGFPGHLGLVNARRPDPSAGVYASVAEAAEHGPVDLALVCVPAAGCADAVAEAAKAGARAAVVYGGGFAEAGPDGERYQRELADVAERTGIRLLGPNTSGFLAPGQGLTASFVPGAADVPAGRIAVVAASGGVNHALAFLLSEAGHGVSLAVGLGNGVDVTAADVLEHLAGDPHTTAVALHIESVADGRRLTDAVARLAATRPVVALVVGRHDVGAFAASHTGALATSWRTTRAALAQAGAVLVDDERELVDAVGALSLVRLPAAADPGVGVVTAQAGPGLLLLDDLRGRRAAVPELTADTRRALAEVLPPLTYQANPVDTGRPGPGFATVLEAVAADPAVDVIAGYALHEPAAFDLVGAVDTARHGVPLVLGVGGAGDDVRRVRRALLERGVPVAGDPRGLAAMTGALLADARARSRTTAAPAAPARVDVGAGPWDEDQAKTLLGALGVPTMPRRACADRAEAHRALAELPGPVAVKLLDAAVLHKTEIGGVRLGVRTPDELDAALDAIEAAGASPTRRRPHVPRSLVESMAPAGVDLVVGARRDPVFGPVVLVGLGGTTAEALADVSIRLAPLSVSEAAAMPAELAARALLDGWRGGPVLDPAALGEVTAALGDLLAAHPELAEIEINPLRITAQGLVALDAVCTAAEAAAPGGGD
ncbi:acyl-CoA synthetase [Streptomyces viridochromogenes]|uniref:Acyl-CoA synthetase n=1 Tax=Streptomyces viridochromogenes TaxID=1938 RepID=A0A0J7Z2W9_STRVR|nr:acetate--CoA ligase family protein [Streptomyces viridochromogenes]KMS69962.1 acyl-CoA synthetase [Streptomyces viridochromogenes]KOG15640.1 acyl-CoA synthetase [Streptomyces viridochromogenes]KOG15672.1 acyl-CoA synthetase [Streptomyces viridochromogenes]